MKFYIKQKVFSLKDTFKIYDEHQQIKYSIQGKYFSLHNKLVLKDELEQLLYEAEKVLLRIMPKYLVFDEHHQEVASIQKHFAFKPSFSVSLKHRDLKVSGSFFAHQFFITDSDLELASIQKKYLAWGDTYEIDIADHQDIELLLFIVIIIDQTIHEHNH